MTGRGVLLIGSVMGVIAAVLTLTLHALLGHSMPLPVPLVLAVGAVMGVFVFTTFWDRAR